MKKYLALFMIVSLCGCSSWWGGDKDDNQNKNSDEVKKEQKTEKKKEEKFNSSDLICPQVAIITQAQEVFDYGGEKPDPSQLVAKARMKDVDGDCGYEEKGIDIKFTLHMAAERGPKLGEKVSFPYFIAIVDPNENILSKQTMTASFSLSSSDKIAEKDDDLHVFIPMPEKAQLAGPDYRVLLGFKKPQGQ